MSPAGHGEGIDLSGCNKDCCKDQGKSHHKVLYIMLTNVEFEEKSVKIKILGRKKVARYFGALDDVNIRSLGPIVQMKNQNFNVIK